MAEENKCIICWIQENKFTPEKAAAFMLGEAIKYPTSPESRFNSLCHKHAKHAHQMGNLSDG